MTATRAQVERLVRDALGARWNGQSPAAPKVVVNISARHLHLTREHVVPTSRGGNDSWMNCITACRPCNGHKGNRLPEEAGMSLHYLPYVPSLHEDMILRGRRILADQMEFLLASVPRSSRLHG